MCSLNSFVFEESASSESVEILFSSELIFSTTGSMTLRAFLFSSLNIFFNENITSKDYFNTKTKPRIRSFALFQETKILFLSASATLGCFLSLCLSLGCFLSLCLSLGCSPFCSFLWSSFLWSCLLSSLLCCFLSSCSLFSFCHTN